MANRLEQIEQALAHGPGCCLVMTASFEDERAGVLIRGAQVCAEDPMLVSVSVRKGHSIEPLIRDSRAFALCKVDCEDKLVVSKFSNIAPPDERSDPFESIPFVTLETGAPVIRRCAHALDCEVVRHFDLEADHELYVGLVVAVRSQ